MKLKEERKQNSMGATGSSSASNVDFTEEAGNLDTKKSVKIPWNTIVIVLILLLIIAAVVILARA
ncbi:hypothetical protein [Euzebyella saccharophila]|uniref:Uncharacterized protein n=1 Tax=Euzebyella saccharophila TaxID=679664 RepID=A0ABV8JNY2_9FLAO|nr:hypothetical protein [Euzebyella saccharophila]